MYKAIALAAAAQQVNALQVFRACQEPEVQQNFDVEGYTGLWYEQRRDKECRYESGICDTAHYSLKDDGNIRVRNNDANPETGAWTGGEGYAFQVDPSKDDGYLKVKFVPFVPAGDYKVLSTDYDNYTVIYGCSGLPGLKYNTEYVWILTKEVNPTDDIIQTALDVVATKIPLYDMTYLVPTPQGKGVLSTGGDCDYDIAPNHEEISHEFIPLSQ